MSKNLNPIALAIPFFFVLIAAELAVQWRRKQKWYRIADAITDIACGITSQVVNLFFRTLLVFPYAWLYKKYHLIDLEHYPIAAWTVGIIGVDFFYYWWHRYSHEKAILWAAHIVHHQSESYNLATALRQAVFTAYTVLPFYLPLALLGVPPFIFAMSNAISTLYQFWIHTEAIDQLGPLETVINTPSHHRVHHARNPHYLDKNYGAILIVWDRLFGSFIKEQERPVYGITEPLNSFNSMWAQVHYIVKLAQRSSQAQSIRDKINVWIQHPGYLAQGETPMPHAPLTRQYEVSVPRSLALYVSVNFALTIALSFVLILYQDTLLFHQKALMAAPILSALISIGALLDGKSWGRSAELLRIFITALCAALWGAWDKTMALPLLIAAAGFCMVFAFWLSRLAFVSKARLSAVGAGAEIE